MLIFYIEQTELLEDFGLIKSSYDWAIVGSQFLVITIVGLYWVIQKFRSVVESNQALARQERNLKKSTWR
jgi:hypothetical protein